MTKVLPKALLSASLPWVLLVYPQICSTDLNHLACKDVAAQRMTSSASKRSNRGLVKLEDSCIGRWVAFLNAQALLSSLGLSGDKVRGPPRL